MVKEKRIQESFGIGNDDEMVGVGIDFPGWMLNHLHAEA